jgi:hypothetical protein
MGQKEFLIDRMRLWGPLVLSSTCFLIGWILTERFPSFEGSVWVLLIVWVTGLIFVGIGLYMVRRGARLIYGILETMAGVGAIVAALINTIRILATKPEESFFIGQNRFVAFFLLAAAIYVLVRGLDNIGEGLADGSKAQRKWNAIFPNT